MLAYTRLLELDGYACSRSPGRYLANAGGRKIENDPKTWFKYKQEQQKHAGKKEYTWSLDEKRQWVNPNKELPSQTRDPAWYNGM